MPRLLILDEPTIGLDPQARHLFALGFGVGSFIDVIEGMSYPQFIAPALISISIMNSAFLNTNVPLQLHLFPAIASTRADTVFCPGCSAVNTRCKYCTRVNACKLQWISTGEFCMDCSCFSGVVCAIGESNEEETNCLKWTEGITKLWYFLKHGRNWGIVKKKRPNNFMGVRLRGFVSLFYLNIPR